MMSQRWSSTSETVPTMNMEKDYQYALLPNAQTHIRLLTVMVDSERVVGSLKAFPLSEAPQFCALSYAWGTDPPVSSFICDSASLAVTEHLLSGLKKINRCNPTTWIWVDAICINQMDNEEKAEQIPLMGKIYSIGTHVLVWLGEATQDTEKALGQIVSIRDSLRAANTRIAYGAQYVQIGLPTIEDPIWKSLADFMCRPWFQRLWVLQEVILAKDIIFICGGQILGFELLRSFNLEIYRSPVVATLEALVSNVKDFQGYKTLIDLGTYREKFSALTLDSLSMLEHGRHFRVKEPVDRVYGLLGIIEEKVKHEIVVDYSDDVRAQYWKLYISVGKLMIKLGHLDFLIVAESEERPEQLPSWIPNWNSRQPTTKVADHFYAGIHPNANYLAENVLLSDADSIQLRGFQIGTIIGTSALAFKRYKSPKDLEGPGGLAAQELKIIDNALELYRRVSNESENLLLEHFSRTLIADTGSMPGIKENHKYLQDAREDYEWYRMYLSDWKHGRRGASATIDPDHMMDNAGVYSSNLPTIWRHRSFFVTNSGRIGLCSQSCRPGDIVCIFLSLRHTYIIRKAVNKSSFKIVSCAYTDGVMYGEALNGRDITRDEIFIID